MDPIVGGALVGAGSSMFGNLLGSSSNKKAAKINRKTALEMQQLGNEFSMNEAQKTRDFQQSMFDQQNEYNSASSQRQRLEDAGLNPYMMMNGGNAGTATSAPSGAQASPVNPSPPQQQAFRYDFSGVSDAINSYFLNKKVASETRGTDIGNDISSQFGSDFMKSQIAGNLGMDFGDVNPKKFSSFLASPSSFVRRQDFRMKEIEGMSINNTLRYAQSLSTFSDVYSKGIVNKYLNQSTKAELDIKIAELHRLTSETRKTDQETSNLVKQAVLSTLQAEGLRLNNTQVRSIQQSYIEAMKSSNAYEAEFNRHMLPYVQSEARWSHDVKRNAWIKNKHEFEDMDTKAVRWWRRLMNPARAAGVPFIK